MQNFFLNERQRDELASSFDSLYYYDSPYKIVIFYIYMEEKSLVSSHSSDLAMDYGHHPPNVVGIFLDPCSCPKIFSWMDHLTSATGEREGKRATCTYVSFSYYFNQTDRFTMCLNACFFKHGMAWFLMWNFERPGKVKEWLRPSSIKNQKPHRLDCEEKTLLTSDSQVFFCNFFYVNREQCIYYAVVVALFHLVNF